MVPNRSSVLAVCLAVTLVLSGCTSTGQLSDEQEKQVVERFEQRIENLDGFTATMTSTVTFDGETQTTRATVWARPASGEMRREVQSPAESAGDVMVSNGSYSWFYDESENRVHGTDLSGTGVQTDPSSRLEELVERYDVVYNGTTTLDGEQVEKVTLVPDEDSETAMAGTMTMYLDAEKLFPRKMQMELRDGSMTATIRYSNVSLSPGIEDDRFSFDPPEGATVERSTTNLENYQNRSSLVEAAETSVPQPDLPDGLAFEHGSIIDSENQTVLSVTYTGEAGRLSVYKRQSADSSEETSTATERNRSADSAELETVQIGNETGTYHASGAHRRVNWQCEKHWYSVSGSLEKQQLVDVAAAIECN